MVFTGFFTGRAILKPLMLISLMVLISACGSDGTEDKIQLVEYRQIDSTEQCEYGGGEVLTGFDLNNNNKLESHEVTSSSVACNFEPSSTLVAPSSSISLSEDDVYSGSLELPDDSSVVTYISLNPFKGSLVFNPDGTYIYTPNENVNGHDVFTYYFIADGVHSTNGVIEINIEPINDAPIALADNLHAYNTASLQRQLLATDVDNTALAFELKTPPLFGVAEVNESGYLTYRANEGYSGDDSLVFNVSDGVLISEAQVSISVVHSALQLSTPSSLALTIEQGVIQQSKMTLNNLGDDFILVWTIDWPNWYGLVTDVIMVPPKASLDIAFDIDTRELAVGSYFGTAQFASAEPGMPTLSQYIELDVTPDLSPPAAVSDLSLAGQVEFDQVSIGWTAVADTGLRGLPVESNELRFSTSPISESNWYSASLVYTEQEPLEAGMFESVEISGLMADTFYFFAQKSFDRNGRSSGLSNVVGVKTLLPPVANIIGGAVTLKESEQVTVSIPLSNYGESPLKYTAQVLDVSVTDISVNNVYSQSSQLNQKAKNKFYSSASMPDHNGNIIIKISDSALSSRSFSQLLTQYKLQERKSISALKLNVVTPSVTDAHEFAQLLNELNALPEVEYAQPDYIIQAFDIPNDELFNQQWALNNEGQTGGIYDADIDGLETWNRFKDGSNVVVAVIDSGVKYDHEDISDNIWINSNEIPANDIDDDGNGYIDDVYGYDFANYDSDPMDDNDHGTHCSGIIAAKGDNGVGISGAAHRAKIMAVKFLTASGSGSESGAIDAIIYAVDNGAKILNNSWGGSSYSQAVYDAISYANAHDVLFIAAAGNSSSNNDAYPSYPANYDLPNVISVASTDHSDQLSNFSNFGMTVDLAAPGSDILSTVINGGYESFSGTSMATPYVSGAAVLLRSNFPKLSALETKELLLSTVDPLNNLQGVVTTGGRLNMNRAIEAAAVSNYVNIISGVSGVVVEGESVTIDLFVDATNKVAGLYEHKIKLTTNVPGQEEIEVDFNVTVLFDDEAPQTVSDLNIMEHSSVGAVLEWTNSGDDGMNGQASNLVFAYSTTPITVGNWNESLKVNDVMPLSSGTLQQLTINDLLPETQYFIAMKTVDNSGQYSAISNVVSFTTTYGAAAQIIENISEPVVLSEGDNLNLNISIINSGDEELVYSVAIEEENAAALQYRSLIHSKGEDDLRVGSVVTQGTGGPDVYGYTWRDSDQIGTDYAWLDIQSLGNTLSLSDDSVSAPLNLGFDFNFYGVDYSQIFISSNGFLSFNSIGSGCCSGQPLPSADGINNIIAWGWKDLHPLTGSVHYLSTADEFIVQFTDYGVCCNASNGSVTAQVIIKRNGQIKIQYQNFKDGFTVNNLSVGIENHDASDGLQIVFNAPYLKDEMAIEIMPPLTWLRVTPDNGIVGVNDTETLDVQFDTVDLPIGVYNKDIVIRTNDPRQTELRYPVTLDLVPAI